MFFDGNMMYGAPLGINPAPVGITVASSPLLSLAERNLYRPLTASSDIRSGAGAYSYVTDDMDGQRRSGKPSIGADQASSSSVVRKPLSAQDVGPRR